jgi:streptogramin lyase
VAELPPGATSGSEQTDLPFGRLRSPAGLAVDLAGDAYVADYADSQVLLLPYQHVSWGPPAVFPLTGLKGPWGIAVDASADVFVTDRASGQVLELPAGSGQQVTLPFTGLSQPAGLAVDAAGDVYVADIAGHHVFELAGYEPTTTAIVSVQPSAPAARQKFSVQVSVAGAPSAGGAVFSVEPTGQVTVSDGDGQSCTATLSGGSGVCQLAVPAAGPYQLTAGYAGLGAFRASASGSTDITVGKG